jgi:cellulose synthase/poly-beta-1,6-N-acetylglucosamine synthase-like glycosyltransferase
MIKIILCSVYITGLIYVFLAVHYQLFLTIVSFLVKDSKLSINSKPLKYAIVVPAHSEELLIAILCENLLKINYPRELYEIYIIADNCTDSTVKICKSYPINILLRKDETKIGKGYALEWAFDHFCVDHYDAVLIIDADTTVDTLILTALNEMIANGSRAIQCNIKIPNRYESWFTQLLYVSRIVNAMLYHLPKFKLGLSSYLMGSGMCFTADLIRDTRWSAFSLSEDWEYFALLIKQRLKVDFAIKGIVFQQESKSLQQATTQRLRWSKGRFHVLKMLGLKLLFQGVRERNWVMADASLALIFPNWSLLINLIFILLGISFYFYPIIVFKIGVVISLEMIAIQILIFVTGAFLSGDVFKVFKAALISPVFLIWKALIDFLSITGIYRGNKWIRTERHKPV